MNENKKDEIMVAENNQIGESNTGKAVAFAVGGAVVAAGVAYKIKQALENKGIIKSKEQKYKERLEKNGYVVIEAVADEETVVVEEQEEQRSEKTTKKNEKTK